MALKKFRLKNIGKNQNVLVSSKLQNGFVQIDKMTDEQAELLYDNGKSHYVDIVVSESKK